MSPGPGVRSEGRKEGLAMQRHGMSYIFYMVGGQSASRLSYLVVLVPFSCSPTMHVTKHFYFDQQHP